MREARALDPDAESWSAAPGPFWLSLGCQLADLRVAAGRLMRQTLTPLVKKDLKSTRRLEYMVWVSKGNLREVLRLMETELKVPVEILPADAEIERVNLVPT